MSVPPIDPDDIPPGLPAPPPGGGGSGGGGGGSPESTGATLPGLGGYLVSRYSTHLFISEEVTLADLLNDVIFPSCRGFMCMAPNGKIRFGNKKPADHALTTAAINIGATIINVDNCSPWINDLSGHLLLAPHTNKSEVRDVLDANYSLNQNSVPFTSSHPSDITITPFAGSDGNTVEAFSTVTVNSFTAGTTYTVTLEGKAISFTPGTNDSTVTIAGFIAGALRGHPALSRRFRIGWYGGNLVELAAVFGTLEVDLPVSFAHPAPLADPTAAPTAAEGTGGSLTAGQYRLTYAFRNAYGQTLVAPLLTITVAANAKLSVGAVTPPAGCSVVWYMTTGPASKKIRLVAENNGAAFDIANAPRTTAALTPDVNRTSPEVMRVAMAFADEGSIRANKTRSNILRGTTAWSIGRRQRRVNQVKLKYREATQDWRAIELQLQDDRSIERIKKVEPVDVNGQGINNGFQAFRIAAGILVEEAEGNFFYRWTASREAGLLEVGDKVAVTDNGSGVVNLPVMIEDINVDVSDFSVPRYTFTARKFANTMHDDSPNEITIPVVSEHIYTPAPEPPAPFVPTNWAIGATATASRTANAGYPASSAINGLRHTNNAWGSGGGWDPAPGPTQAWLEVDLGAPRHVEMIRVYTVANALNYNTDPGPTDTFTVYGNVNYSLEYWNGTAWAALASVSGNNLVRRDTTFTPVVTQKIRFLTAAPGTPDTGGDQHHARVIEIEVWNTTMP